MKLRIRGNTIRFRLSQTEMVQFQETGSVQDTVEFGPGTRLGYGIKIAPVEALEATYTEDGIRILLPAAMAQEWALPDRVAVRGQQSVKGEANLTILLEKDFACLTPRKGEDDSDAFPNPGSADR